jgi:hypothetical protein
MVSFYTRSTCKEQICHAYGSKHLAHLVMDGSLSVHLHSGSPGMGANSCLDWAPCAMASTKAHKNVKLYQQTPFQAPRVRITSFRLLVLVGLVIKVFFVTGPEAF